HLAFEAEAIGQLIGLIRLETQQRMQRHLQHLVRALARHFLDLHAAFAAGDQGDGVAGAVDGHAQVKLLGDIDAGRYQQHVDRHALGAGLVADHAVGEHEPGRLAGFLFALDELDEACFTASAGIDLRLDDTEAGVELAERRRRFIGRAHDLRRWNRHARIAENLPRLVFVDFHDRPSVMASGRCDKGAVRAYRRWVPGRTAPDAEAACYHAGNNGEVRWSGLNGWASCRAALCVRLWPFLPVP